MKVISACGTVWTSLKNGSKVLFRALGLNLIVIGLRSIRHLAVGKGYHEPTKIAIRKSRNIALLRALIHLVPVGVALWEVIFNWNTYYAGSHVRNQALYQFGAKLHEMTAQASIAAIMFSYVRHELSLGQGLPFGALFSGLQVSQASYLWSVEFWGSIYSPNLLLRRKIIMGMTIIMAVVLAATVGPSSAILLIPRLGYWPAGSTDIWINVTASELWPDVTNGSSVPLSCLVADSSVTNSECPSNEWQAIKTYLDFTTNLKESTRQLGIPFDNLPSSVEVTGQNSLRRLFIGVEIDTDLDPGSDPGTITATTQQAAVADALTATGTSWFWATENVTTKGHGNPQDQLDAVHSITQDNYQPFIAVSCQPDVIHGLDDHKPVGFPLPPLTPSSMLNTSAYNDSILLGYPTSAWNLSLSPSYAFEYSGFSRSQILDTPGSPDENRLRWIELPQDPFNGTSIGAIALLPRAEEDLAQQMIVCNLGAGWGGSSLNMSTSSGASQQVLSHINLNFPQASNEQADEIGEPVAEAATRNENLFFSPPVFPQRMVTVTEEWAVYLNPSIPSLNTTLFHHLMTSNVTSMLITTNVKTILAGLLANGLSGIGSTSKLQGTIRTVMGPDGSSSLDGNYWFSGKGHMFEVNSNDRNNWVKLHVSSAFQGFAYNTHGAFPKLAICILLLYCAFALGHVLYAGISGISSTCWDSIAEVTALAVNSPPTRVLRNTCAGITEFDIFKLPVRILTIRDEEGDGEHLELVFGSVDEKSVVHRVIKPNRAYGTLPSMKPSEKML